MGAAAAAALAVAAHRHDASAIVAGLLAAVLVIVTATDLERRIIPNAVVLPATAAVLTARIVISPGRTGEWLLAAILAAAVFGIPSLINASLMGMGDVKLALLLGAGLGRGVVAAIVLAVLALFPFALWRVIRDGWGSRRSGLPFAPFLAVGGLVVLIAPLFTGS
jgi:leader peptidase (prepilin peptidase)/N-methyltransferase